MSKPPSPATVTGRDSVGKVRKSRGGCIAPLGGRPRPPTRYKLTTFLQTRQTVTYYGNINNLNSLDFSGKKVVLLNKLQTFCDETSRLGVVMAVRCERKFLMLSPCGHYLNINISSDFLGIQIIGIMLIGAIFALFGTLGLFWIFEQPNRKRKLAGAVLAAVCIPMVFTFYGWGLLGHPGAFWGLCRGILI